MQGTEDGDHDRSLKPSAYYTFNRLSRPAARTSYQAIPFDAKCVEDGTSTGQCLSRGRVTSPENPLLRMIPTREYYVESTNHHLWECSIGSGLRYRPGHRAGRQAQRTSPPCSRDWPSTQMDHRLQPTPACKKGRSTATLFGSMISNDKSCPEGLRVPAADLEKTSQSMP